MTRRVAGPAVAAALLALTSCGAGTVEVEPPRPATEAAATRCASLLDRLPGEVLEGARRTVTPDGNAATAWGDPAIVLRCGVPEPRTLKPTSECVVVNKVGWLAQEAERGYVFTTIGRSDYVEMRVPKDYAPEPNALVDVAAAVRKSIPERRPCQ